MSLRLRLALLISTVAAIPAAAQSPRSDPHAVVTVGTATAKRGQVATGVIQVPAGIDSGTNIAVAVINGAKPGPVLAVVSGAHGTEYASIIAVQQLVSRVKPAELSGTLIVVPLVNVPSFERKIAHVNPVDSKSMNRYYPGNMQGTQTDRASYLITTQVVEQSDHLIDLHGGDLDENLRPYSYWTKTGKAPQDSVSREMLLAFGLDMIIISADRPKDPAASRYLENTASTRGKPSITAEAGRAGRVDADDVSALVDGTLNVMGYLRMLDRPVHPVEHPVWIEKVLTIASEQSGVFFPLVDRGTFAAEGMKIGYVTDHLGRTIAEYRAPAAGIVLFIRAVPSLVKGETIANVGVPAR
ncbi:MAG: M14 family metallopeptidase [Gemmatimonadaceae bacterium]